MISAMRMLNIWWCFIFTGVEACKEVVLAASRGDPDIQHDIYRRLYGYFNPQTRSDDRASVCIAIVNAISHHIRALKKLATDMANRQLSYIAKVVTMDTDRDDSIITAKSRALSMRRMSLSTAVRDHRDGMPLKIRSSRARRSDALDQNDIIEQLWHAITQEKKGKARRCSVRRPTGPGEFEFHRIHFQSGTNKDCYQKALTTPIYQDWMKERRRLKEHSVITFSRFCKFKCFCVRPSARKFCICSIHDGWSEFLRQIVLVGKSWHDDLDDESCTCSKGVNFTTSSFGDAAILLTSGRSEEVVMNSTLAIVHRPWKYECVHHECDECKNRFLSCPAYLDTKNTCTWRAYATVPKLRKDESVNELGLLVNGKRAGQKPRTEKELTVMSGTRYQFTKAAHDQYRKYAPHNYDMQWDSITTEAAHRSMTVKDLMFEIDFSAYPQLRSEKELTCQTGRRASLETAIISIADDIDIDTKYGKGNYSISMLTWNDDVNQDPAMVWLYTYIHKHRHVYKRTCMHRPADTF